MRNGLLKEKLAIYDGEWKSLQHSMGSDEELLSRNEHQEKDEGGNVTQRNQGDTMKH